MSNGAYHREMRMLWEMLMLEGFQAGLAWITILRKRDAFRAAFADFDPAKVAAFDERDIERLMADPGIVRARAKIEARSGAQGSTAICTTVAKTSRNFAGPSREVSLFLAMAKAGSRVPALRDDLQGIKATRI